MLGISRHLLVAFGEISSAVTDIMAARLPVMVDGDNGYGDVKTSFACCTATNGWVCGDHVRGSARAEAVRPYRRQECDPSGRHGRQDLRVSTEKINRELHAGAPMRATCSASTKHSAARTNLWRLEPTASSSSLPRRRRTGVDRQEVRCAADGYMLEGGRTPSSPLPSLPRWASRSRSTASR